MKSGPPEQVAQLLIQVSPTAGKLEKEQGHLEITVLFTQVRGNAPESISDLILNSSPLHAFKIGGYLDCYLGFHREKNLS